MRKTTTKLLAGSLALVAFATPLCVWAGSQDGVLSLLLGAASLGDDGKSPQKLSEEYLREARQAMNSGDFATANNRIAAADALGIKYSPLHMGDSPKKARAALEKLQSQKPLPSQRATPPETTKKGAKDSPHDPFLARGAETGASNMNQPMSPSGNSPYGQPTTPGPQAQALPRANANSPLGNNRYGMGSQGAPEGVAQASAYGQSPSSSPYGGATAVQVPPNNGNLQVAGTPPMLTPPPPNGYGAVSNPAVPSTAMPNSGSPANAVEKQRALEMTKQARAALERGDVAMAEQFARQAMPIVPESAYGPQDDRPGLVMLDVQKRKSGRAGASMAGAGSPTAGAPPMGDRYSGTQAIYQPERDSSRNTQAMGQPMPPGMGNGVRLAQETEPAIPAATSTPPSDLPLPMDPTNPIEPTPEAGTGEGLKWFRKGTEAMSQGQADQALQAFRRAYAFQGELDAVTRKRLHDFMQNLGAQVDPQPNPMAATPMAPAAGAPGTSAATRQLLAEVSKQQMLARDMREKQPKQALELLQRTKEMVATAGDVDQPSRELLIRRLDMSMNEIQQFITQNAPQIELDEQNRRVEDENSRIQKNRVEVDARLAKMVDDFNKLCDEGRFAEAQVVAKRAGELAPNNPLAVQLYWTCRMLERTNRNNNIIAGKENAFVDTLAKVDESAIMPPDDYNMPSAQKWGDLKRSPYRQKQEGQFRKTPRDLEIEQRLSTPVSMKFQERSLGEVLDYMGKIAQVPIYKDPEGMKAEGVDPSTTMVNIDLTQDISLKSALKLILDPLHLTYIVKDEVLKITTEDQRRGQLYEVVYPVGDLVIPIPNFAPNGREGINAAMREAYDRQLGFSGAAGGGFGARTPPYFADSQMPSGSPNKNVLAQLNVPGGVVPVGNGGPPNSGVPQSVPFGPGGVRGGSQADFEPLIDLITGTIATATWSELGGPGTIEGFDTTLSLVVSQTQEVHEQIADLLTQLRRLQDLQVTIEVRFITLTDEFFERIGFDFDANLGTHTNAASFPFTDTGGTTFGGNVTPSAVIGLDPTGRPTTPFGDVQFRQNSFANALPPFGGFDPATSGAATFGFAILSDIEAYFLVSAAHGDDRSNILQAPKVTLFNGQQASVSDQTQRPFVISVTPVVGDFAVGQQPVIVVLSEGTSLTVQAVVSENRRFVRLTVVPFFSQIGDVDEFTFEGTTSTKKSSSEDKKGDDEESSAEDEETVTSGTTVQLPEFSFVSVTTTVSVPDGGTVLLGGIKRLAEGRTERGVPILGKLPYINRLFKNVGIGRTTTSLMMMVTPRIIIQEEEEENLLGTAPAP